MDKINFAFVKHTQDQNGNNNGCKFVVDGITSFVSYDVGNRYYAEIMRQVEAGTLTIQEAD
jgi:hypothetical protein